MLTGQKSESGKKDRFNIALLCAWLCKRRNLLTGVQNSEDRAVLDGADCDLITELFMSDFGYVKCPDAVAMVRRPIFTAV